MYDTISHINKTNKSGLIMAADFEAAFETVSWRFVRAVLEGMNFGNNFIGLINMMYLNQHNFSRILLNGFMGEKIYMQRGIRQGDPVSGYLFNIAVEILAKQVNESSKLTGINMSENTEIRISQYADDTILFLDGSERSLNGIIEELTAFSKQSGLKLNWEKTACLPLGRLNPPDEFDINVMHKFKWVREIKILGILFKANISNITELNLDRKLILLENEIAQWNRRYITPMGKITVIKSLLLSKLVHLFMALPNPSPNYIKKIEQILYSFLWNNKPDRIKRAKAIQKYGFDGLQMIDITSFLHSLKLSWLKRFADSTAVWTTVARLEQLDPMNLLTYGTAKLKQITLNITNIFWREVIQALIQFNQLVKLEPDEILREKLWFSDYTKFKTSMVKQWDINGLRFIGDLFNPTNGNILSREEIRRQYRISMTFLCYESLIRSLPQAIKNRIHTAIERPNMPFKLQLFVNQPNISKYCYSLFVNALREKCFSADARLEQKWNRDIGFHLRGSMLHVRKVTKSVYLIYLHYIIINIIITTNKLDS